jgi:hypothetical protein
MNPEDKVYVPNSFQTPNIFIEKVMACVDGAAFKILMTFTRYLLGYHHDGGVQMGHDVLKTITGLSHQGIINGAEELTKLGLIKVKRGPRNSGVENTYFLNLDLTTGALLQKAEYSKNLSTATTQKSRLLVVKKVDTLKIINKENKERVLRTESDKLTPNWSPPKNQRCGVDKQLLSDPPTPPVHPKELKLTRPADPRVRPFLDWYASEFETRIGEPYLVSWTKESNLIRSLPAAFDLDRLKGLAIRFFETQDPWVREKGGFTVGVFKSQINKLASTDNGKTEGQPVFKDLGNGWLESQDGMRISRKDYERRWKRA